MMVECRFMSELLGEDGLVEGCSRHVQLLVPKLRLGTHFLEAQLRGVA
jgi:hypothetical protein